MNKVRDWLVYLLAAFLAVQIARVTAKDLADRSAFLLWDGALAAAWLYITVSMLLALRARRRERAGQRPNPAGVRKVG